MEKLRRSLGSFAVPLLSILLAFIIGGIIMAALGADPFTAVKFLFQGAFGSRANIGTTLNKATPLMFTALCACFAYKCGVFNLGGEGQFLMGSIAAFLTAYFSGLTGFAGILLALLAGTLAGGIWGLIPGVLKITRGQNEMIISIMLNYVATLFMGVLYTSWIRDENIPQTPAVSKLVQLPRVISGMRFTWGFVLALVVGLVMYYVLFWTSGGFKLRAVGYNMTASRFNGIPVKRYILTSFIISGAIAGLGGGAELLGTQFRLINGFGAGYGFDGVAMALIGQLHPIATVIVALFFAALRVGSTTMQAATGVPTSVSDIIQALVIVFSVAGMALTKLPEFESWKSRLFPERERRVTSNGLDLQFASGHRSPGHPSAADLPGRAVRAAGRYGQHRSGGPGCHRRAGGLPGLLHHRLQLAGPAVRCAGRSAGQHDLRISTVTLCADHTVYGMAINIFAPALASFIYRVYFGTGSDLKQIVTMPSVAIPGLKDIPVIGPLLFDQSPMVYLAILLVVFTSVFSTAPVRA